MGYQEPAAEGRAAGGDGGVGFGLGGFVKRACKLLGVIGIRGGEGSSGQVSLEFRFIKADPAVRLAYDVDQELIPDSVREDHDSRKSEMRDL